MINPPAEERAVASTKAKRWGSSNTSQGDNWGAKKFKAVRYCARMSKAMLWPLTTAKIPKINSKKRKGDLWETTGSKIIDDF